MYIEEDQWEIWHLLTEKHIAYNWNVYYKIFNFVKGHNIYPDANNWFPKSSLQ
jgi:hypothetical protein